MMLSHIQTRSQTRSNFENGHNTQGQTTRTPTRGRWQESVMQHEQRTQKCPSQQVMHLDMYIVGRTQGTINPLK